jgi:hypothetical protein
MNFPVSLHISFIKNAGDESLPFYSDTPSAIFFKNISLRPEKPFPNPLRKIERQQSHSERKVLQMQKESTVNSQPDKAIDEELIDTLIAISVVAKRLAANLRKQNNENGGKSDEQNE